MEKKSYSSPKVVLKTSKIGKGLFAKEDIKQGELIVDYSAGPGKIIGAEEALQLYKEGFDYMLQIDDDSFFAATNKTELEDADFINHSCSANCGIKGALKIVAMRKIKKGEEITIDYALLDASKYTMKCHCKSKDCRKVITGEDWKKKDVQERYAKYFPDYLQKRIDKKEY